MEAKQKALDAVPPPLETVCAADCFLCRQRGARIGMQSEYTAGPVPAAAVAAPAPGGQRASGECHV